MNGINQPQPHSPSLTLTQTLTHKLHSLDNKIQPFLPVSTYMIIWYFIVIIALVVDYFLTIYFICFHSWKEDFQGRSFTLPVLIVIFVLDILISLNTSFIENGRIIAQKPQIRKTYLKTPIFPLDLLVTAVTIFQLSTPSYYPFLNFLVYIKILKLSQFDTLITLYIIRSPTLKLGYYIFKHMMLLVMVCHFIGCFFFYLDVKLQMLGWYPREMLWIYGAYAYEGIVGLPGHWQYCYAFYYAVVTLSGVAYGDLTPLNQTEAAYTLVSLLIPLIFYAYILSVVHGAISERRAKALQALKFRRIAKKYFEQSGIELYTIPRFVNYLSHASEKAVNVDNSYLQDIAPRIKHAYIRDVIGKGFDFSIFYPLSSLYAKLRGVQEIVYAVAVQEAYPPRQPISCRGNSIKLYYIASGQVSQYIVFKDKKYNKLHSPSTFLNQHPFYTGLQPPHSNHSLQTYQFTIFHCISLSDFLAQAKQTPIFEFYHYVRNQILCGARVGVIRTACLFCDSEEHVLAGCDKLRVQVGVAGVLGRVCERGSGYRRRERRNRKRIDSLKPMLYAHLFDFLDQGPKIEEKSTQTTQPKSQSTKKTMYAHNFDSIQNWKHFHPQYCI